MNIKNSKKFAIRKGKWTKPNASFYDTLMKEDNYKALINEAFLLHGKVFKETPYSSSKCKYPHHSIVNGELVLNEPGVRAAYARAKQMGVYYGRLKSHLDKHLKELGIFNEEKKMQENFEFIESALGINEDDYFNEASHGKLKYDFRFAYDADTGHKLKIVYLLDNIKVDYAGHAYNPEDGKRIVSNNKEANKEVEKNIKRKGNVDHKSSGQKVIKIIDEVTGENLEEANTISFFASSNPLTVGADSIDTNEIAYRIQSGYANLTKIKVGEIDNSSSFKSTKLFNGVRQSMDAQLSLKSGRGVKPNNIFNKYTKNGRTIPMYNNPTKKEGKAFIKDYLLHIANINRNEPDMTEDFVRMVNLWNSGGFEGSPQWDASKGQKIDSNIINAIIKELVDKKDGELARKIIDCKKTLQDQHIIESNDNCITGISIGDNVLSYYEYLKQVSLDNKYYKQGCHIAINRVLSECGFPAHSVEIFESSKYNYAPYDDDKYIFYMFSEYANLVESIILTEDIESKIKKFNTIMENIETSKEGKDRFLMYSMLMPDGYSLESAIFGRCCNNPLIINFNNSNNETFVESTDTKNGDIEDKWYIKSDDGVDNCCLKIKGYDKPMRGRSSMICLKKNGSEWEVMYKKHSDGDYGVPGGGWNKDEDPKDAAIRELQEETLSNVKDVEEMGTLIEYHTTVKDWVKQHIDEKDWWYGYYSIIFVGIYDGEYKGKVDEMDREDGYDWISVDDIRDKFPKEYIDAIDSYLKKHDTINECMNWIDNFVHDEVFREKAYFEEGAISSPYQLLDWMKDQNFKYGWITRGGKVHDGSQNIPNDFYNNFHLQSPTQLISSKVGVCWDFVELERLWFTQNEYKFAIFYIVLNDSRVQPTHTFLVFNIGMNHYWFEYSWEKYRGIHRYGFVDVLIKDVIMRHRQEYNDYSSPVSIHWLQATPKYGITYQQYMKYANKEPKLDFEQLPSKLFRESVEFTENTFRELSFEFEEKGIISPQKLLEWMDCIEYDKSIRDWHLRSVGETYFDKKGNCHDQSLFEFIELKQMGYECGQLFFLEVNEGQSVGGNTHTLTWYIDNNNYYWFEHSWENKRGIHGPYQSIDEMKKDVYHEWETDDDINQGEFERIEFFDHPSYKIGMTLGEYVESWVNDNLYDESDDESKLDPNFAKKNITGIEYEVIDYNDNHDLCEDYFRRYNIFTTEEAIIYNREKKNGEIIINKSNDTLIGLVLVFASDGTLTPLKVMPEYRGYGFSNILMRDAVDKYGAKYLGVYADNEVAVELYKKFGFEIYKTKEDEDGTLLFMRRADLFDESSNDIELLPVYGVATAASLSKERNNGEPKSKDELDSIGTRKMLKAISRGDHYNHILLSFNDDLTEMYSYNNHGIVKESINDPTRWESTEAITISVMFFPREDWERMHDTCVDWFKNHKSETTYAYSDLLKLFYGKPIKNEKRFLCSSFAGYILSLSDRKNLSKDYARVRPEDVTILPRSFFVMTVRDRTDFKERKEEFKNKVNSILNEHKEEILEYNNDIPKLMLKSSMGKLKTFDKIIAAIFSRFSHAPDTVEESFDPFKFDLGYIFTEADEDNPPNIDNIDGGDIEEAPPELEEENNEEEQPEEKPEENNTEEETNNDQPPEIEDPSKEEEGTMTNSEEPNEEKQQEEPQSLPKQTDAAEKDKNGVNRKKLYIAFIEWCKDYNNKNTFGSVFDKDAFNVTYPFVPHEMRYFYRLANPMLCVLAGDLTFFPLADLKKINSQNPKMNELLIFAATPDNNLRVFNNKDKKVYKASEENGNIKIEDELGSTFDLYLQGMINQGDYLNAPSTDEKEGTINGND